MLNVCISFDYELFMGKNLVSAEEILFEPAGKVSQLLKELGVSATFFADVCCPIAVERTGNVEFSERFSGQLAEMSKDGHDVQLHIHSNWVNAQLDGLNLTFPPETYRIHHWMEGIGGHSAARQIIRNGIDYLNRAICPVLPDYRCVAYRAGGYCLQPEKKLAGILYDEGIRIDSSVCQGRSFLGENMYYDYRKYPQKTNVYISREYGLSDEMTQPVAGGILEIPVASYSRFPYHAIALKKNVKMPSVAGRGSFMSIDKLPSKRKLPRIFRRAQVLFSGNNMLTFDSFSAEAMTYMIHRYKNEHRSKNCFIATIAHPKLLTDVHIENMKRTIAQLQQDSEIRFVTMRQISDEIDNGLILNM